MAEQPVNLSTAIYLGVFSRAEQRVLQAIFKTVTEGGGRCVATLATLARDSNTSKPTTRNAIAQAVATWRSLPVTVRNPSALPVGHSVGKRDSAVRAALGLFEKADCVCREHGISSTASPSRPSRTNEPRSRKPPSGAIITKPTRSFWQ
jgi:hypothetical protein